jgi:hypothetical protein
MAEAKKPSSAVSNQSTKSTTEREKSLESTLFCCASRNAVNSIIREMYPHVSSLARLSFLGFSPPSSQRAEIFVVALFFLAERAFTSSRRSCVKRFTPCSSQPQRLIIPFVSRRGGGRGVNIPCQFSVFHEKLARKFPLSTRFFLFSSRAIPLRLDLMMLQ